MIAAVEEGEQSLEEIRAWIIDSVRPLFLGPMEEFVFAGEIWYLEPVKSP